MKNGRKFIGETLSGAVRRKNHRGAVGKNGISLEEAMQVYYSSKLSDKIHSGTEGVQYLDYKVLAQILVETEPSLLTR